jgi:hypothetical protein
MPQRIEFEGAVHEFPDDFTDTDIAAALASVPPAARQQTTSPSSGMGVSPAAVAAADLARRGVVRAGEEIATSPLLGRAVSAVSKPAAQMTARAVGATHGLPGYAAGEVLTSPGALRAAETGIRAGGGLFARLAGSRVARALTGPAGFYATLLTTRPQPDADSPVMKMQTARQRQIEADYIKQQQMNVQRGRTEDIDLPRVPDLTRRIAEDVIEKRFRK